MPETIGGLVPWLVKFLVICVVFWCIKAALDYFVFPSLPEPARMIGYAILALVFLVALLGAFGMAV